MEQTLEFDQAMKQRDRLWMNEKELEQRGAETGIRRPAKNVVDVEDFVDTPLHEATTRDVAMANPDTGALELVRADTVSEMKSEMCEAIPSLVRETCPEGNGCDLEQSEKYSSVIFGDDGC